MWSFFKLLFSRNYWRLLFRSHTWRETGLAFRRAHKDKRARKQLRLALTLVLTPVLCVLYLMLLLTQMSLEGSGLGFFVSLVVLAGFVSAMIRFMSKRQKDESIRFFGPDKPIAVLESEIPAAALRRLGELALLHAVLAGRAGSESFLKNKALPDGVEVTTRRNHVALLRQYELWDRIGPVERDLLLLPDGHWPEAAIDQGAMLLEPLRLLRWVLRIDQFLPTVGSTLQLDYQLARSLVESPALALEAAKVVEMHDLRIARNAANAYFQRCAAEGVKRGLFAPESEENATWARDLSERMAGQESDDLLLGTTIVAAADDAQVRFAAVLCCAGCE